MKVFWACNFEKRGESAGFYSHNRDLLTSLQGITEIVESPTAADVAVHVCRLDRFEPIPGLKNVLFSSAAGEQDGPTVWSPKVSKADVLVGQTRYVEEVFRRFYFGPIQICPLGVDCEVFRFVDRAHPSIQEPFRFLYSGTANGVKNIDGLVDAFVSWLSSGSPPNIQLILKISEGEPSVRYLNARIINGQFVGLISADRPGFPGIVIDSRPQDRNEMAELYGICHAYVTASLGESWGLSVTEAMATGLPCIVPEHTGFVDYATESEAFMIPRSLYHRVNLTTSEPNATPGEHVALDLDGPEPLINRMKAIHENYGLALDRGRAAAARMRAEFTWEHSARRFLKILESAI